MGLHTVIALGYTNVSADRLQSALAKQMGPTAFGIQRLKYVADDPLPYAVGRAVAETLAAGVAKIHRAPLCIGVVCVQFTKPGREHSRVDIAVTVENGVLLETEVPLNPVSCKRRILGLRLHETVYAREALDALLEHIRVRQRSMLLEHF